MSDRSSLSDDIAALAPLLMADGDLIPFQRRVGNALNEIEAILGRGVPLRRLAAALGAAGLQDGAGKPVSEAHLRAAVSRARSKRRITERSARALPPPHAPGGELSEREPVSPAAIPGPAAELFARQDAAARKAAADKAGRPDFSSGLFETPNPASSARPQKR